MVSASCQKHIRKAIGRSKKLSVVLLQQTAWIVPVLTHARVLGVCMQRQNWLLVLLIFSPDVKVEA